MTDLERRKVFWLLKKYSSYTAWKTLGDAYAAFVDEWLIAAREATMTDVHVFARHALKVFIDGRIAFEKGLPKLRRGDRSIWRNNSQGLLSQAADAVVYAHQLMNPGEYVFDWMKNKESVILKEQCVDAHVMGLYSVCELSRKDLPAYWMSDTIFRPLFGPFNFPQSISVVSGAESVLVASGVSMPFDGIYEPVWGGATDAAGVENGLNPYEAMSAYDRILAGRCHFGCMNYFVAHSVAPMYRDKEKGPIFDVAWRLIWKDERYLDGKIPEEEAEYLNPMEHAQKVSLRCDAGQPCPRTGYWFTPAKLDSRRYFQTGEIMPSFQSEWGSTIWQWDMNQEL